jgi:hypothetical protein
MRLLLLPFLLLPLLSPLARAEETDIAALLEKIRKGPPAECAEALGTLEPGKEERAAKPIATRLVTETDAQARAALKEALAAYKGQTLVQAVKTGLEMKECSDEFRTIALELLGPVKEESAVNLVVKIAFRSEMKAMREAAQQTLAGYGDLAVSATAAYMRTTDQKIADEAIATLKAINTEKSAVPLVNTLLVGSEKELLRMGGITNMTREHSIEAIIAMGDTSVPALLSGLDNLATQKWCSYCLQKISGEFFTQKDKAGWTGWWKKRLAEKAGR